MILSLDLDGTLLSSNMVVPKSTQEYLNKLKNNGEIIVINSGRTISHALESTESAYFANYVIGDTGSTIYDVNNKLVIRNVGIEVETGQAIFNLVKNRCEEFSIFTTTSEFYRYYNKLMKDRNNCIEFTDYQYIIDNKVDISHISFSPKNQEIVDELVQECKRQFEQLNIFAMVDSFGTKKWIEITNKKNGKFKTLLELTKMLNMKVENIISFGDAINDLEMIQNSGIGVAMKNAIPELKAEAKSITEFTNDECGVERWLKNFYILKN